MDAFLKYDGTEIIADALITTAEGVETEFSFVLNRHTFETPGGGFLPPAVLTLENNAVDGGSWGLGPFPIPPGGENPTPPGAVQGGQCLPPASSQFDAFYQFGGYDGDLLNQGQEPGFDWRRFTRRIGIVGISIYLLDEFGTGGVCAGLNWVAMRTLTQACAHGIASITFADCGQGGAVVCAEPPESDPEQPPPPPQQPGGSGGHGGGWSGSSDWTPPWWWDIPVGARGTLTIRDL